MFTKFLIGALLATGMTLGGLGYANANKAARANSANPDCCYPGSPCCTSGSGCCLEAKIPDCCYPGSPCCESAATCCLNK